MTSLPTELPQWYKVDPKNEKKGWIPKTTDIVEKKENNPITYAWDGAIRPKGAKNPTVSLKGLQILSPIQVGGGSLPECLILPATIGGVPCIPGSSIKGVFLSYLRQQWPTMESEEQEFWLTLTENNYQQWQPRKIRFETIFLKNVKPYPLNPQQTWQVFDDKDNKLGIQWQVAPKHPIGRNPHQLTLQVSLKPSINQQQRQWLECRLTQLLRDKGIGRGTASGFGRLASRTPNGRWEIRLTGMKPCYQPHKPDKDRSKHQNGLYRWTPQVLRANLRGHFTRFALTMLPKEEALKLSDRIFGGLGQRAQLTLTSYLKMVEPSRNAPNGYKNIPASDAHSTWLINVDCNSPFQGLIQDLLVFSSRIGGLGPGWRRPPHQLTRFNGYRGSQFMVTSVNPQNPIPSEPISELIKRLLGNVRQLANDNNFNCLSKIQRVPCTILSIWQGEREQWEDIVHGVCSTQADNRPSWCGNSQNRPSGYAVRQYDDSCFITIFDVAVEATLEPQGFQQIWQLS